MTMLYSFYSYEGIIFAADSRITRPGQSRPEPSQQKVRRVPRVGPARGLLGYYGLAQVGRQSMSDWLAQVINRWPGSHSPAGFASHLVEGLNQDTTQREKQHVSGFHFGAFRRVGGRVEPVFFHIRNTYKFNEATGEHYDIGPFWTEEQLLGRDIARLGWQPRQVRPQLRNYQRQAGLPLWYRNGDLALFATVSGFLQAAFAQVSRLRGYGTPDTLTGWERLARTMVVTTTQVARSLYRGRFPSVGDEAHVLSEPWPSSS